MKDNKYMENIDELMKFVFEGRLLGVNAQAERRRLQELKSYGILEEDNDICKCYKQIINLLNDNKEYILDVLYKKNINLIETKFNDILGIGVISIFFTILVLVFLTYYFPTFVIVFLVTAISLAIFAYIWHVEPNVQTRREYSKAIKAIKKKIRMYGTSLSETKELVKENENEEQPKEEKQTRGYTKRD